MAVVFNGVQSLKKSGSLLLVGFVSSVVLAGCTLGSSGTPGAITEASSSPNAADQQVMMTPTPASEGSTPMIEAGTTTMVDGVQVITIEAGSFYYKPNEFRVKKGEKVKVVLNSVSMMHDFVIDELDVKLPITKSGETGSIEFTPTEAGTFEFYCSVGQHRQMGQIGTLIVE